MHHDPPFTGLAVFGILANVIVWLTALYVVYTLGMAAINAFAP